MPPPATTTASSAGVGLRTYCRPGDFSSAACTLRRSRCGRHHEACATARHHRSAGQAGLGWVRMRREVGGTLPVHLRSRWQQAVEAAVGLLASTCMQQAEEVADNLARDHAVCYGVGEPTHAAAGGRGGFGFVGVGCPSIRDGGCACALWAEGIYIACAANRVRDGLARMCRFDEFHSLTMPVTSLYFET